MKLLYLSRLKDEVFLNMKGLERNFHYFNSLNTELLQIKLPNKIIKL